MPHYPRHTVLVLVDRLDLAVLRALRYVGSLHPTDTRAVHLMIDSDEAAVLQREWLERGLGDRVPLAVIECPDRRLIRGATQLALATVIQDRAEVTLLLPRRTFRRISQRLLHDRTADHIAETAGRLPHVVATIVAFDTTLPTQATERIAARQHAAALEPALTATSSPPPATSNGHRTPPDGTVTIGSVSWKQRVTIEGRISLVQASTAAGKSLEVQLFDETGGIHLLFFGRTRIPGLVPGATLRATGMVGEYKGHLALANPRYEITRTGT